VQVPGLAYRLPIAVAREHVFSCTALHGFLMAQSQRLIVQLSQSAICNRFHTAVERLARWLLLTAEHAEADRLDLTHDFVAQMVGAPRTAVTQAAAVLRRGRVIEYERGQISICSRERLRRAACECVDVVHALADGASGRPRDGGDPVQTPASRPRGSAAVRPRDHRRR